MKCFAACHATHLVSHTGMPASGRRLAEDPSGPLPSPLPTGGHEVMAEVLQSVPQEWSTRPQSQDPGYAVGN